MFVGGKASSCQNPWCYTASQYGCTCAINKADPQGSFEMLPEGNTVAITPENITAVPTELFSYHYLILWVRIPTTYTVTLLWC